MIRILVILIEFLLGNAVRLILTGAAIGVTTSAFLLTAFNAYLNNFLSMSGGVDGGILGLAAIAGVHIALSMIVGSIVFVVTIQSIGLRFFKK
ncbi:hypothetical protein F889_02922 [Acinetobacter colistiniresistens]|uniref:DUF2523 domain-containing protein n=1 Tax=Acinetobacter colistiniresistens TaxID=280145 RepID=N9PLA4_9GAMM|nr:DUF2523 family protein [Acinetobacter colistiniresistens]ENX34258.1 hypothetical protein F889_02922 [Acinetobacter colistiniresistens]